jgi:hypothetical protein
VNKISFNSSLLRELRAIRDMNRLIETGELSGEKHRVRRVYMIEDAKAYAPARRVLQAEHGMGVPAASVRDRPERGMPLARQAL